METLTPKENNYVKLPPFIEKVFVPLTSFTILAFFGWIIGMSVKISNQESKIIVLEEYIKRVEGKLDKAELNVQDLKIENTFIKTEFHDIISAKDDRSVEEDKRKHK